MSTQLQLGDITIEVIKKDIKNVHLSVHPPTGRVRISAPQYMNRSAIRLFAISKLPWIKQHQTKLHMQEREPPREYIDRESHYVWGRRYLPKIVEHDGPAQIELKHKTMLFRTRMPVALTKREALVEGWYRQQVKEALRGILDKWQPLLGVRAVRVFVQKMKTKWGSSNPVLRHIRLNTELAKKPPECLEYVVLHELAHFLARRHDKRFIGLLDQHLSHWRTIREQLNSLPLTSPRLD